MKKKIEIKRGAPKVLEEGVRLNVKIEVSQNEDIHQLLKKMPHIRNKSDYVRLAIQAYLDKHRKILENS